jgi:hypothetical protein
LLSRVAVLSAQTGRTRICLALALTSGASLARAQAAEVTASVGAARLVVHLDRSGFVIMRKPIPVGASMIIRAGAASKASSVVTPGQKISFPSTARPLGPRVWFPLLRGALYADGNHPRIVLRRTEPQIRQSPCEKAPGRCAALSLRLPRGDRSSSTILNVGNPRCAAWTSIHFSAAAWVAHIQNFGVSLSSSPCR